MASKYSFSIGLKKSLKNSLIVLIPAMVPILVGLLPSDIANLTIAGVIGLGAQLIHNWLKNR